MEVFEVHITGDESIHKQAEKLGAKTIQVNLLKPDKSFLRTEHMTSQIMKCEDYASCLKKVDQLTYGLITNGVSVFRAKIESPYYDHYKAISIYMESHFQTENSEYPISNNARKPGVYLATDREYKQENYEAFRERYAGKDIELCLYDTDSNCDFDWLNLYH